MEAPPPDPALLAPPEEPAPPAEPGPSFCVRAVNAAPEWMSLDWRDDVPSLRPLDEAARDETLAQEPWRFVSVLDVGVWGGRREDPTFCRSFAVLRGRTVALCEFVNDAPLSVPEVGDPAAREAITAVLRGLAGPQRLDVQVVRMVECPAPLDAGDDGRVWVFLPDMHLPLVPPMPDLPPDLIPDPTRATCFCHGPVMSRLLGGAADTTPRYAAVGAKLSRDPNEWFYLMADHYREVAEDLTRFVNRFQKCASATRAHLVQLGGLFEIWAGFDVTFHATGRAGQVLPKIVRGAHLDLFVSQWRERLKDTPSREAVTRVARLPPSQRTLLQDDYEYMARDVPLVRGAVERRALDVPPLFRAEHHHALLGPPRDLPPVGLLALREQAARFLPWQRGLPDDFRTHLTAWGVETLVAEAEGAPVGAYVSAYTHVPFLANVRW